MKSNMILSASGWRKVFSITNDEQDSSKNIGLENQAISVFAALVFSDYVKEVTNKQKPTILCGMDSRPTGSEIADATIKTLAANNVDVNVIGITAAPEIMAYSKNFDGFIYISASHNPIGHNGIKFGLNTGGVLNGTENAKLVQKFNELCDKEDAIEEKKDDVDDEEEIKIEDVIDEKGDLI